MNKEERGEIKGGISCSDLIIAAQITFNEVWMNYYSHNLLLYISVLKYKIIENIASPDTNYRYTSFQLMNVLINRHDEK